MPQYFGFNDEARFHTTGGRHWQPSRLSPNAFRFGLPWDRPLSDVLDVCDAMKLGSLPDRLGIFCLGPAAPFPESGSFYNQVKLYLDGTPSNLMVQVWNEPNNLSFGDLPWETCRDLIYAAVKADGGRGRVIGPAMTPGRDGWGSYMLNAYQDYLIPAALHIYPRSSSWTADFDTAIKVANMANGDDLTRFIYITEMALLANVYSWYWPVFTRDAYVRASQQSNVRAVMFHRLYYGDGDPFDTQGLTYFLDQSNNETVLTSYVDQVR